MIMSKAIAIVMKLHVCIATNPHAHAEIQQCHLEKRVEFIQYELDIASLAIYGVQYYKEIYMLLMLIILSITTVHVYMYIYVHVNLYTQSDKLHLTQWAVIQKKDSGI